MNNLPNSFYINNRIRLCKDLPNTLVVITAHKMLQYSYDTPYSFRQESNFLYLTGIKEPDLTIALDTNTGDCSLFIKEKNDYQKEWDGDVNIKDIEKISGIKCIFDETQLEKTIKKSVSKGMKIGVLPPSEERIEPYGFYSNPARKILYNKIEKYKDSFVDIRKNLAILRMIKTDEEINEIKKAIKATGTSLEHVKNNIDKYNSEKEIEKDLTTQFILNGGDGHGFDPIVANERNAATIHYKYNDSPVVNDSLLLLDVGARVGDYSADVSRTYTIGKLSKRQKDVLEAVLDVQKEIINVVKPGLTIKNIQEITEDKLLKKYDELEIKYRKLPHGVSHHLGLDVHDAADYCAKLEENMVITIEPGIYLLDEKIGVRIEDDILITRNGNINLSGSIPY